MKLAASQEGVSLILHCSSPESYLHCFQKHRDFTANTSIACLRNALFVSLPLKYAQLTHCSFLRNAVVTPYKVMA
jgi:hypothetical protein